MQSGELVVTGHSHLHILLRDMPVKFEAHFKNVDCVPCNPGGPDKVTCHLEIKKTKKRKKEYYLNLVWEVSSIRTVVWKACY